MKKSDSGKSLPNTPSQRTAPSKQGKTFRETRSGTNRPIPEKGSRPSIKPKQ